MKFCYVDESGTGDEPCAVMVGVIVDAQRMHVTKGNWVSLLKILSNICDKEVKEFHTRDFYSGNGIWRTINGLQRAKIITAIFGWLKDRKHNIVFTAVDKARFYEDKDKNDNLKSFKSLWCFMGLHIMLSVQKGFQREPRNKGNTVFIFDKEVNEQTRFGELVNNPPEWIHEYYNRKKKQAFLDQVVDVPYYGDSEDVHLIQIADLIAYFIRRYLEINQYKKEIKYFDEKERVDGWIKQIELLSLPLSTRYPSRNHTTASELFLNYAPELIRTIGV